MDIGKQIEIELEKYPPEDRLLMLMRYEERLGLSKYSKRDYKEANKIRKRLRLKRIKENG